MVMVWGSEAEGIHKITVRMHFELKREMQFQQSGDGGAVGEDSYVSDTWQHE